MFDTLSLLENTPGKNAKQLILTGNRLDTELQSILDATFNYLRRFYMKKWNAKPTDRPTATHEQFIELLSRLESRTVTGNAALAETEAFFRTCSQEQAKWYTRTLHQDLKIGVSVDTAIKCGFNIPKFEVQLAMDGKKCKKLETLLAQGCLASRKFDGYRCVAVVNKGEVVLFSRNGTEYENFPTIKTQLAEAFPEGQFVLDGEIMSDDFNSMQQTAFASKRGTAVGDVTFHVFDLIPYEEWMTDKFEVTHPDRVKLLTIVMSVLRGNNSFQQVEHIRVATLEEVQALEQQFITLGFEGVMINPPLPYFRGRKTNSMLKFKTMLSMECEITGFYEGEEDTRHRGSLGGVIVLQENGKECRVGSGFSDDERRWIWDNKEEVLRWIIESKYQELTPDGVMRFPTKFRMRHDKAER